jgi:hypothetical protein
MTIDWTYWENQKTVNLRAALQLSLGLDPNTQVPALETDISIREQYFIRLLVAKNCAPGASWVVGRVARESGDVDVENTEVSLRKFVGWIIYETTLELFPIEFRRISGNEINGASTQFREDWTQRSAKEFIEEKQKAGSFTAAGKLHGVSRQRYAEVYKKVTEHSDE